MAIKLAGRGKGVKKAKRTRVAGKNTPSIVRKATQPNGQKNAMPAPDKRATAKCFECGKTGRIVEELSEAVGEPTVTEVIECSICHEMFCDECIIQCEACGRSICCECLGPKTGWACVECEAEDGNEDEEDDD